MEFLVMTDDMIRLKRGTLFVGVVILVFCGCSQSPQVREARYLEKGQKEFERKNYAIAILQLKNAAQAQPRDAEPYYQLGLAYLASNDFNTAAAYFQKASELNPKHTGAQLKLAELMATSRTKEVVEQAQKRTQDVLTLLPDDTEALNVLAITELRLGKPASAEAHLEQALRKSPSDLRSSVALAQARLARKDVKGAEEALKQAAAQSPKSPMPRVHLGGFYLALGRTAEAEQQFRQALTIDPKNGPALMSLGAMQVRAGQADQAEQTYRQVSALPDKQYKPIHALFLFQSGKRDQAVAEFEKLAAADPADRDLRTDLVRAYLAVNRVGDAEKVLTAALKKNGLDVDALLQRSRIYLRSGKYTEAQTDLNQVLHFRSNSAEAHYLLSKVAQGREDTTIRKQELGQVLKLDPSFLDARIDLAELLLRNGGAQSSLQLLDEAPQSQKGRVRVVVQRNWALLALGQRADARNGIDQVLSVAKIPEALLQDAALKLAQKDYAGARASAEAALSLKPEDARPLSVLVQTYAAQNQLPIGLQKAREHGLRQPASASVQQFLGQLLLANGDRAGARKAFEAANSARPDVVTSALALAEIDVTEGKRDEARKRLSAVVSSHPGSIPGHLLLAQLEMTEGKNAAAIDQFRKSVTLDDTNALALNGLAYLLAENKQPDEALKYAQQAKELAPDSPAVDDTLGWTYFQKGMYSMAVTYLDSAVAKQGTAVRQYHLAMACVKAGDPKRGRQVFDTAMKMDPNLPEAQAARQLLGNGK
jgi:tetratricopeptide (TPR) repeat protein